METWVYFIHPPREDFAATMTDAEDEVWGRHWRRIQALFLEGSIIAIGPTLGRQNTGISRGVRGADRREAVIALSGGAAAELTVERSITGEASEGATVSLTSQPVVVDVTVSSGRSVRVGASPAP